MKRDDIQPGYIPHLGPVSPTKLIQPDYHKSVVDNIKDAIGSARERVAELLKSLVTYRADAIVLTGREKYSGEHLRVFYFGLGENLSYLTDLLFSEYEDNIQAANVSPWRAPAWCEKFQAGVDIVILDLPWPVCRVVRSDGFLTLAPWVNMIIPIGKTWEDVVGRWSKNVKGADLRPIRKHQLNFRMINSEQAFRDFYNVFYVPYVTMRFGDAVFIEPEEKIVAVHEYGEIIEILRENTVIAEAILIDVDGSLGFHWIGAPVDIDPPMREGAFAALYYFIIRLAYERGCNEVDCFTSRPTLSDGVLRFKRKWGAMLSDCDDMNGQILLKPMRINQAVLTNMGHNPLITRVDDRFIAKVLFAESEVSASLVQETIDTYYTDGLQSMRLYSLHGFTQGAEEILREKNIPIQLFDLHGVKDPLQIFCRA